MNAEIGRESKSEGSKKQEAISCPLVLGRFNSQHPL